MLQVRNQLSFQRKLGVSQQNFRQTWLIGSACNRSAAVGFERQNRPHPRTGGYKLCSVTDRSHEKIRYKSDLHIRDQMTEFCTPGS